MTSIRAAYRSPVLPELLTTARQISALRNGDGAEPLGLLLREEVRERPDVGVGGAVERGGHQRVAAGARVVAVGVHRRLEVLLALRGEPRHLLAPAEVA